MSIYIVEGKPGHGKSTFATILATRWQEHYSRRRLEPRRIVANFPMMIPGVEYVECWDDIRDVERCIVIIDEAPMWFSGHTARDNQKHMGFFSQHRKDGNSLIVIAQSWSSLDLTVRERTCEGVYNVRRLFGPTVFEEPSAFERAFGWWSLVRRYDSAQYGTETRKRCLSTELIRLDRWHGKFDTLAKIGSIDSKSQSRGAGLAVVEAGPAPIMPGDGVMLAGEIDLRYLDSVRRAKEAAKKRDRRPLAAEVADSRVARAIPDFRAYCLGTYTDEMGVVHYRKPIDLVLDEIAARKRGSEVSDGVR